MFYIRPEGETVRQGFNFYPWSERKWSIGFVLLVGWVVIRLRLARHVKRFYCSAELINPETRQGN